MQVPGSYGWNVGFAPAIALVVLLSGCAGMGQPIPDAIRTPPAGNLQLAEVVGDPERFVGRAVRWGGEVMLVRRDGAGNALVEVLGRRLDDRGEPYAGGPSDGRFHIRASPEVDPELYRDGTAITVAGTVSGTSPAIESASRVPLVEVSAFMSWGPTWYPAPYYWHPHYPYYHYPYGYPYGYHFGFRHHHYPFHHHPYWW